MSGNFFNRRLLLALGALSTTQAFGQSNALTPGEQSSGYVSLFNGADLSNWKGYQSALPPASWTVGNDADGKTIQVVAGGVGSLINKDFTYQNFDLKIEWKVPVQGNSGIFIRYLEINTWGGASGPEAQVVDVAHPDGQQALHRAGTNYDMFPLNSGKENWFGVTGSWNQFRIVAFNNRIAHYGDGKKLLEYDMTSAAFDAAYARSKYNTYPRYREVHPGSIYLQHHGEIGIKFRNIRIKKLAANQDPWANGSPYLQGPGLVENLTFADNLYATPSALAWPPASDAGAARRLAGDSRIITVLFSRPGRNAIEVKDLAGRTVGAFQASGIRALLPE